MRQSSLSPVVSTGKVKLKAPRGLDRRIREAYEAARRLPREELSPAQIWLEDNALFLLEEADAQGRETRFSPRLPVRLLSIARRVFAGEEECAPSLILRAAREETGEEELTQAEIDLLRPALRCALLEKLDESLSACRRAAEARRLSRDWALHFSQGKTDAVPRDDQLLIFFLDALSRREDFGALRRADEKLSSIGKNAGEARQAAEKEAAAEGLALGRIVSALRALPSLPFHQISERLSPAARELRLDPTYGKMDDESRAVYRQGACRAARRYRVRESDAARAAVELAEGKTGAEGEAGYYLLERPDLIGLHLHKRKKPSFALRHRTGLFLAPLYGGGLLTLALAVLCGAPFYVWPLIPLCVSEILRYFLYRALRRFFPARALPRLSMERLTENTRALVVTPVLLSSPRQAIRAARHLLTLRLANPDPCLDFLLLADFQDSADETRPEDEEIVEAARLSVESLNRVQGGGFYYLHRARKWDMGQRAFTGRERKRGALDNLNRLLTEGTARDAFVCATAEDAFWKGRYAYVITLDGDTFLPAGTANRLIGAMEHPLQKGRVGVIQPRMEVSPGKAQTRVQKLWGGMGGADPYHLSVQDVYQDVFGRGSFVGKGIYAPASWREKTAGLPAGVLLSHDLIEGETTGSAVAEDVVLFDGHPATVAGWQKRLHRWTRGDWQLLPFLWDRRLSLLSRHKIWDNLRRSLLPGAQALLLMAGAALKSPLLCLLALPWPFGGMFRRLPALPGKAFTTLDAAVRALYRLFVSHRNLLTWVTADQAEQLGGLPWPCAAAQLAAGALLTALSLLPGGVWPAAFAGLSWAAAPLAVSFLNGRANRPRPMTEAQTRDARELARDTWRFFEAAVGEDTRFLPPDNVQQDPDRGAAMRTSPTNMGLYLLSCCAAMELHFIGVREAAEKADQTLKIMEGLPAWKGHFYNWYDLNTLRPLPPRFVSTVDSGNLMGCLLCCAQLFRLRGEQLPLPLRDLPARLDALARRMDFSALYDGKRRLFSVGWDDDKRRLSPAHYDCLASEARLASFLAIMTGQVERKHWRYLSRATVRAGGGPALLSWGGTLFEYLMPALLLPLYPGTLLGEGCASAVRAQMAFDPRRPFGVSESGYYAFDPELNYQYRAFGLPALALSPDTAGEVVAPYASVLALPLFPRAAAENMRRMTRMGWRDEMGFFEAADYAPQRIGAGPRLVKSHMAHHQGMILCALCNALTNGALRRAFMSLPAAAAHEDLLWEKAPGNARRRIALPPKRKETTPETAGIQAAKLGLPLEANALLGGGTAWVLTSQGQGSLSCGDMLFTRFCAQAGAQTGPQFYLRDPSDGAVTRPAVAGKAAFGEGMARYLLFWRGLKITLRCCVDPLSGAAVALMTMENMGPEEKEMEAVSFLEIAQGDRAADEAHPNFRDLGVRVSPWGSQGLVSRRLPRDEKDLFPLIGHKAAGDALSLRRQGDRALFLGRGTYASPEQMKHPTEDCSFRLGDVTAPCLSLRVKTRVPGEGKASLCFFTAARDTLEALDALPLTLNRARAAFALAASQEKMTLRSLSAAPDAAGLYRQILGALYFYDQPHQQLSPAPSSVLWEIGVSGALPVLLILMDEGTSQTLVNHALKAHAWMRARGVKCDIIFFGPEETAYFRPVRERTLQAIAASPSRHLLGQPGGVRWAEGNETKARALMSAARLTLRSGQSLKDQLSALRTLSSRAEAGAPALTEPVPAPELRLDNSFGGFTAEGGYWIKNPPPVPWHQLLCGPAFGTLVCESGILHSYALNSRLGRITRLCPDVKRGVPSEEIYLVDGEDKAWPLIRPAALYEPGAAVYRCRAGQAETEVTLFAHGEKPLSVRSVTLRAGEEGDFFLCWLVRFALGERPDLTRCRAEGSFVFAQSGDMNGVVWACLPDAEVQALCAAGCFGLSEEAPPPALFLPLRGVGSVGFLRVRVTLKPREALRLTLVLGWAENESAARRDMDALLSEGAVQAERNVRAFWAQRLSGLRLFSMHETLERMMNLWLPYQVISARLLARMGPYQAGGAVGFRDQLQDCLALLHTDPAFVRAHLLLCAAHQFPEGDVQHWWHPPRRGVRTRISDDKLFLPCVTAWYVTVTGDADILTEEAPYLLSAPLKPEEEDRYEEPAVSPWTETLLSHCLRAVDSVRLGSHGLPLMGGGDWNDGMNRVGGQTGESVWLGFFMSLTLKRLAPFCPTDKKESLLQLRRKLLGSAESAWTGSWYLRAWRDGGEPLGGPDTDPPRIDLISQCFAALAGAPRDHARAALQSAVDMLYDREAGLVKLLSPPFAPEENAGYIGGYLPGVRENGGQYTHAVPWLVMALCRVGEYALAWEIVRAVLPAAHTDSREKALCYKIEPYVLAGDVYAGENRGMGGWSWYTGSAAWLYWTVLTELIGFEKRGNKVRLSPRWDTDEESFTLTYRFGSANYHFTASRDVVFPTLDGEKLTEGWAELTDDGRTHEARFPLRFPIP